MKREREKGEATTDGKKKKERKKKHSRPFHSPFHVLRPVQGLRDQAAQSTQHGPPGVDDLDLPVPGKGGRVGGQAGGVPAVVPRELASQVGRRRGEGAQEFGAVRAVPGDLCAPDAGGLAGGPGGGLGCLLGGGDGQLRGMGMEDGMRERG